MIEIKITDEQIEEAMKEALVIALTSQIEEHLEESDVLYNKVDEIIKPYLQNIFDSEDMEQKLRVIVSEYVENAGWMDEDDVQDVLIKQVVKGVRKALGIEK